MLAVLLKLKVTGLIHSHSRTLTNACLRALIPCQSLHALLPSVITTNLGGMHGYVCIHIPGNWGTWKVSCYPRAGQSVPRFPHHFSNLWCTLYLFILGCWPASEEEGLLLTHPTRSTSKTHSNGSHAVSTNLSALTWYHVESTCQELHSSYCPKSPPCWNPDKSSLLSCF